MNGRSEAERSLPSVIAAIRDFERVFADAIQGRRDVQLKLMVSCRSGTVKAVRLHQESNYELDGESECCLNSRSERS